MKRILALVLCAVLLIASVTILTSAEKLDSTNALLNPKASYLAKGARLGHATTYTTAGNICFNKWNADVVGAGDTVYITAEEAGDTIGDVCGGYAFTWWRVLVCTYDTTACCYKVTEKLDPTADSDKSTYVIPADGFCVAIHNLETFEPVDNRDIVKEVNPKNIESYNALNVGDAVDIIGVPSPLVPEFGLYEIATAPVADGVISAGEYGDAVCAIDPSNPLCDYFAFKADDKYCTGNFYACYDANNLYLAWDISSEHYKYADKNAAGSMWATDCIQINIGALPTTDDHMLGATEQPWGTLAAGYDCMVQVGIGLDDDGTTVLAQDGVWFGNNKCKISGKAVRDDTAAKTIYEVVVKLEDLNAAFANYDLTFAKGSEFALAFSVNTDDGTQRVLRLRDSGSIFGRNDYSKAPNAVLLGSKAAPEESKKDDTPDTGDNTIVFVLVAVFALAAGSVVLKKVR